jgi:predicted RNA binding protein YcfA (HicA-like mRNA interferase family)
MPRKIRDLIKDLEDAGFINRGGRGSHRNFVHSKVTKPITISGNLGDDARPYQEKAAKLAIEESKK